VLEANTEDGGRSLIPMKGTVQIGGLLLDAPPFVALYWSGTSVSGIMRDLNEHQIVELLCIADSMCIHNLRIGTVHLMLHKIVTNQMKFTDFFLYRASEPLILLIQKIYEDTLMSRDPQALRTL
jgi:hypothetical protein